MQTEAHPRDGQAPPPGDAFVELAWVRLSQRDKPPRDFRHMWWVLALVLVGHVVVVWLVWATPQRRVVARQAIEVTLIEPESALPPPPPLVPPPPLQGQAAPTPPPAPPPERVRHPVPRAPDSMAATLEDTQGKPLDLYGTQGQIRLPQGGPPSSAAPAYRAPEPKGAPVLTIKNPVQYKPTRFNRDWAPLDQTRGGKLLNEVIDKTTIKKTVRLPTGDRVHCAISPVLLFAGGLLGCHGEIPPPPKNDNDIRLSMPPPETLTGKKVPLPSSASSVQSPASAASGG
jgi:hypothetical protein